MARLGITEYGNTAPEARQNVDEIEYSGGKVAKKAGTGWLYDWIRPEAFQDALGEKDVTGSEREYAYRKEHAGSNLPDDSAGLQFLMDGGGSPKPAQPASPFVAPVVPPAPPAPPVPLAQSVASWADPSAAAASRLYDTQTSYLQQLQADAAKRNAEVAAREAAEQTKRDSLYNQLLARASQTTDISPDDPEISGQVNAFRNEQERGTRNFISDLAESAGPLANIQGQKRIANERAGINTGNLQAQLLSRKFEGRRAEISDALNSMRGMLTTDQQANLQRELDSIDNQMQQVGLGYQGAGSQGQLGLGFGNLGLGYSNLAGDLELGRGNLGLGYAGLQNQKELGLGNLGLGFANLESNKDLSLKELLLRRDLSNTQNNQFFSDLTSREDQFGKNFGLDAWQRARELERLRELPVGSVNYGF